MSYDLGEITDNFNQATISLLDIVDSCVTRDDRALFETVKHKLSLMMNTDPVFVLDSAGKYIYKYRDLISGEFDTFSDFIMNTEKYILETDSKAAAAAEQSSGKEEVNFAHSMLAQIRNKWTTFGSQEKKMVRKLVKKLLSEYCKYIAYSVTRG